MGIITATVKAPWGKVFGFIYNRNFKQKISFEMNKELSIKELTTIPGVGKSIADDLWNINIKSISDLKDRSPENLYELSNQKAGVVQDRCLLYVFRCAVYFANTPKWQQEKDKLKWWYWKDKKIDL